MTINELLAAVLACLEGSHLVAYSDTGGVWSIGIGSTKGVHAGMTITPAQQAERFAEDQAPLVEVVKAMPLLAAAAYGDFGFNCGRGALLNVLAGRDTIGNPRHTTDASGKVRSGLVNRRHLEQVLLRLSKQFAPAPAAPVT